MNLTEEIINIYRRIETAVTSATPAGTNTIGKLAANSGVDIGDVDVTSVPADPFGVIADAIVAAGAAGSYSAKQRRMTQGLEDLKTLIVLAASSNIIGKTQPFAGILETGITEIIGADDAECAQNEYSSTADLTLGGDYSGELLGFELITDKGDGAVQAGAGVVMFFSADPNTTSGDAAITVVERKTLIGEVNVAAGDWDTDANGGSLFKQIARPFHSLSTIYCVFKNTDSSAVWNSGAGDNEKLFINVWFNRWS